MFLKPKQRHINIKCSGKQNIPSSDSVSPTIKITTKTPDSVFMLWKVLFSTFGKVQE